MRWLLLIMILASSCGMNRIKYLQSNKVKPSNPILLHGPIFFVDSTYISYSSSELENSNFTEPTTIFESKDLSFYTITDGGSSDTSEIRFFKLPEQKIDSISCRRIAHNSYSGNGITTLIDHKKGSSNFRSEDWLGYKGGNLDLRLNFKERAVEKVVLSFFVDQPSWIFAPSMVSIFDGKRLIVEHHIIDANKSTNNKMLYVELEMGSFITNHINIKINSLDSIPKWHDGTGSKPWLFIDEILVY